MACFRVVWWGLQWRAMMPRIAMGCDLMRCDLWGGVLPCGMGMVLHASMWCGMVVSLVLWGGVSQCDAMRFEAVWCVAWCVT